MTKQNKTMEFTKDELKKLEAAAPLMYEALRSVYECYETFESLFPPDQVLIKEALKKATE